MALQQHDKRFKIDSINSGYDGFFKIDLIEFKHTLYQGGWTDTIRRELFGRGEAAVLLLYDLPREVVVLIEQCRAGALTRAMRHQQNEQAWLLEPVAGMIDAGETPEMAARREAIEEAGIEITDVEFICEFYPSPGGSDEILHLFAAEVNSTLLADFAGLPEDHEDIRILKVPFAEAKKRLLAGGYNVASTIIALQWLFFQKLSVHKAE